MRPSQRQIGSVQASSSSSGRMYEEQGATGSDRLMIHDRRMLEELFREALMIEEYD
jgi:hypothetical protein